MKFDRVFIVIVCFLLFALRTFSKPPIKRFFKKIIYYSYVSIADNAQLNAN